MLIVSDSWNRHMFSMNEKKKKSTRSAFSSKTPMEEYGAAYKVLECTAVLLFPLNVI